MKVRGPRPATPRPCLVPASWLLQVINFPSPASPPGFFLPQSEEQWSQPAQQKPPNHQAKHTTKHKPPVKCLPGTSPRQRKVTTIVWVSAVLRLCELRAERPEDTGLRSQRLSLSKRGPVIRAVRESPKCAQIMLSLRAWPERPGKWLSGQSVRM